jgi:hypothetical protein
MCVVACRPAVTGRHRPTTPLVAGECDESVANLRIRSAYVTLLAGVERKRHLWCNCSISRWLIRHSPAQQGTGMLECGASVLCAAGWRASRPMQSVLCAAHRSTRIPNVRRVTGAIPVNLGQSGLPEHGSGGHEVQCSLDTAVLGDA